MRIPWRNETPQRDSQLDFENCLHFTWMKKGLHRIQWVHLASLAVGNETTVMKGKITCSVCVNSKSVSACRPLFIRNVTLYIQELQCLKGGRTKLLRYCSILVGNVWTNVSSSIGMVLNLFLCPKGSWMWKKYKQEYIPYREKYFLFNWRWMG